MTVKTETLIFDAMDSGREYLPRLYSGLDKVVNLFRTGNEGEAIRLFNEALDGMEWLVSLTQALLTINVPGKTELLSSEWLERAEGLGGNLRELSVALANGDYVLIGDLIEYELLPYIDLLYKQGELLLGQKNQGDN